MKNKQLDFRALLAFGLLVTAIASPATAIENGDPDRTRRIVGVLGFDFDGPEGPFPPFGLCSGFVISDRVFVTAAHCITAAQGFAMSWAVTLEPGSPRDPVVRPGVLDLVIFNVTDFPILVDTVSTTLTYIHPEFDPLTLENDIAVLEFLPGTFTVRPARLAETGFLDRLDEIGVLRNVPVGLAGYGADKDLGNFKFSIPGYRNRGFSAVSTLSEQSMTLEPTRIFDARTLPADSGSPQFLLGRVVSLTSVAKYQRVDTPAVQHFLAPFVGP